MRFLSFLTLPNAIRVMSIAAIFGGVQLGTYLPCNLATQPDIESGLGPEAAGKEVPFKGTLQAIETNDDQFPTILVDGSGSGNATHLGHFSVTYEFVVDLTTLSGSGSAHFIAANGDSLLTAVTGQATVTQDPDVLSIVETYTITGGTGRFAGATGSFTVLRLLNTVTGVTSGSMDGSIVIP